MIRFRLVCCIWIIVCCLALGALPAEAEGLDQHERHAEITSIEGLIRYHARSRGLRPEPLIALVVCEAWNPETQEIDPLAIGDDGHSHGPIQLHDGDKGLLRHYRYAGFESPYDTEQAIVYLVKVAAGDYLSGMPEAPPTHPYGRVALDRWSCAR